MSLVRSRVACEFLFFSFGFFFLIVLVFWYVIVSLYRLRFDEDGFLAPTLERAPSPPADLVSFQETKINRISNARLVMIVVEYLLDRATIGLACVLEHFSRRLNFFFKINLELTTMINSRNNRDGWPPSSPNNVK